MDAKNFLNDILEILYLFSRRISLGPIEKDMSISEAEVQLIDEISKNIDIQDIGLFWQFTLKTIDDLRVVGNENLTLEMYIMQIIHLKNLGQIKEQETDMNELKNQQNNLKKKEVETISETNFSNDTKSQLKSTNQIQTNPVKNLNEENSKLKAEITNFKDLIKRANDEREIELKYDLERNVKLVSFNKGKIDISFNEKLNKNFIKNLTEKLLKWTGERWIISLSKNAQAKSIYEKDLESKNNKIEDFKKGKVAQEIEKNFPDAKLIDILEDD